MAHVWKDKEALLLALVEEFGPLKTIVLPETPEDVKRRRAFLNGLADYMERSRTAKYTVKGEEPSDLAHRIEELEKRVGELKRTTRCLDDRTKGSIVFGGSGEGAENDKVSQSGDV